MSRGKTLVEDKGSQENATTKTTTTKTQSEEKPKASEVIRCAETSTVVLRRTGKKTKKTIATTTTDTSKETKPTDVEKNKSADEKSSNNLVSDTDDAKLLEQVANELKLDEEMRKAFSECQRGGKPNLPLDNSALNRVKLDARISRGLVFRNVNNFITINASSFDESRDDNTDVDADKKNDENDQNQINKKRRSRLRKERKQKEETDKTNKDNENVKINNNNDNDNDNDNDTDNSTNSNNTTNDSASTTTTTKTTRNKNNNTVVRRRKRSDRSSDEWLKRRSWSSTNRWSLNLDATPPKGILRQSSTQSLKSLDEYSDGTGSGCVSTESLRSKKTISWAEDLEITHEIDFKKKGVNLFFG